MLDAATADQHSIRFTAEPLREHERAELATQGRREFEALFANIRFVASSGFGTKVRSSDHSTRAIICVPSRIHATLPEVADVFFSDRTNAAIGFAQSQAIYNFDEPSAVHPLRSCGLRWSLWHSPSKLIRQRDICYLEYMDTFVDENGRRGWARCTQSLVHRSCPPLINSHNIVRAHLGCSGTIYTETDTPGVLDVVTLYDCDTKGVPAWMTKFVALRKAKNAHQLEHLIRLTRAANDSLVADFTRIALASKKTAKACVGCGDVLKWSIAGHRKCRECHELLCKSCNDIVHCAIEGGKKLNRICVHCVDRFLAEGDGRRIDMYTDSSSHRSARGYTISSSQRSGRETTESSQRSARGNTPSSKVPRKVSNSSRRSTRRLSDSTHSHSGSTDGGARPESPTPMLEAKGEAPLVQPFQPSQRLHRQPSIQNQSPQQRQHQALVQDQSPQQRRRQASNACWVPIAPKESPALVNLGVSRYKTKRSGDVDLSYLSNFKSVETLS